jgi:hypothetical protein
MRTQSYSELHAEDMKQVPSSFCFYLVSTATGEKFKPVTYTASGDEDVSEIYVEKITEYVKMVYNDHEKYPKPKIFTNDAVFKYRKAKVCHICEQPFTSKELFPEEKDWHKVWDHCHLTGEFRGAAHMKCNREYRLPKHYPVVFHNLAGYDAHLFVKKLDGKLTCIPNTDEKYISFSREVFMETRLDKNGKEYDVNKELRFIDSYKFMASSLSSLLKNVKEFPISATSIRVNNWNYS